MDFESEISQLASLSASFSQPVTLADGRWGFKHIDTQQANDSDSMYSMVP